MDVTGIIVMDNNRSCWRKGKQKHGYINNNKPSCTPQIINTELSQVRKVNCDTDVA